MNGIAKFAFISAIALMIFVRLGRACFAMLRRRPTVRPAHGVRA